MNIGSTPQPLQRGHTSVGDAARYDEAEIVQVSRHIEREAMTGDPAGNSHANRSQLLDTNPYSGQACNAGRLDTAVSRDSDQHLFEIANVPMNVATVGLETDDRIPHNLTWTVIGDVTAATRFQHVDATRLQHGRCRQNVRASAVSPYTEREHVRMLCEEEDVADATRHALFDKRSLLGQRLGIRDGSETTNLERPWLA